MMSGICYGIWFHVITIGRELWGVAVFLYAVKT